MKPLHRSAFGLFMLAATALARAEVHTANDLAWMTGYWSGPVGELVMEENWSRPLGGTLASMVRMSGKDGTQMVELVIIREQEGSLVLALQQFNPDFSDRTPAPQTLKLVKRGESSVTFEDAASTAGIRTLTYSRSPEDTFTIEAGLSSGDVFRAVLSSASAIPPR